MDMKEYFGVAPSDPGVIITGTVNLKDCLPKKSNGASNNVKM